MRNRRAGSRGILCVLILFFTLFAKAQSPGLVVRPAGGPYPAVLDPNGDGLTSPAGSAGFTTSDVGVGFSEIPYKKVPPFKLEPVSDLVRGPNTLFSDIVRSVDSSGFYVFNDGTNLLFRIRMGGIVSGSKGYSILLDTDERFGATGPYADPNFQPATTGINGNHGFELEVVLETNFRVAVYNVDGSSTATLLTSYPLNTHSMVSVALTTVSNTPDYFYDFYVPISALPGVTAASKIRLIATTVMAPKASIGGPRSDVYGLNDSECPDTWSCLEDVVNALPAFKLDDLKSAGAGISPICTAPPVLNAPIGTGTVTVTGTWTSADPSLPSTAKIYLYKDNVLADSTVVNSGSTWSIPNITAVTGSVFHARALAAGESSCLNSNSVKAGCASITSNAGITMICFGERGFHGNRTAGHTVKLYTLSSTGVALFADDNSTTYRITYPTATTWVYDGPQVNSANPCTGGSTDVPIGSYGVTSQVAGSCESDFVPLCVGGLTATATPTITPATLYNGNTSFSGTAPAGAHVRMYQNGKIAVTTTADGTGNYTFTGLSLNTNDAIQVGTQLAGQCVSTRVSRTVTCFTQAPIINTDNQGNLIVGATSISGKAGEPAGTTIRVYTSANALVGTTTVSATGTWSLSTTVAASTSYYATAQNGTCAASTASATAVALSPTTNCATIDNNYTEGSSPVTGSFVSAPFSGRVRLYLDGTEIGFTDVTSASSWSITVPANTLYPGGVLTVSTQGTGLAEKTDCVNSKTVACSTPVTPTVTPTSVTISRGNSTSFTISNSVSGILYALVDGSGTNFATSKFGTNGSLNEPTRVFNTVGTYNLDLKAISLSGPGCVSQRAVTVNVSSTLPVRFLNVAAKRTGSAVVVSWTTAGEQDVDHYVVERSTDARNYERAGSVKYAPTTRQSNEYSFIDAAAPAGTRVYYRVREVSGSGAVSYSPVVTVQGQNGVQLTLSPNPAGTQTVLSVFSSRKAPAVLNVLDPGGRTVRTLALSLQEGSNAVVLDHLGKLPKGAYVVQLNTAGVLHHLKLAIQ